MTNIVKSSQLKFQVNRIISLRVRMAANWKNVILRKTRLKIYLLYIIIIDDGSSCKLNRKIIALNMYLYIY